jgi:hypothetical protein
MTQQWIRLACVGALSACLLCGCTHAQFDACSKGLSDPYGNTRP